MARPKGSKNKVEKEIEEEVVEQVVEDPNHVLKSHVTFSMPDGT